MTPYFIYFGRKATYTKHTNRRVLQKTDSLNARRKASRVKSIVGHDPLFVDVTR